MKILKNMEEFFRIQLIIGFILLALFIVFRRKYLVGLLGFSDNTINYINEKTMEEETMEEEIIKKNIKKVKYGPKINTLRVGYFVPTETGFMG